MDLQLTGKKAFISGSASGIGYAIAKWLVLEGVDVVINGRDQSRLDLAVLQLQSNNKNVQVVGLVCDFSNAQEIAAIKTKITDVDILINNVGIYTSKSFQETTDEDWLNQYQVNVMSGVRLSRHCLPHMLDRNWGRIIFISSECVSLVPIDLISYSASKAAIHAVSRGLAQLTKGSSVTVNTVMPGSTMTDGAVQLLDTVAAQKNLSPEEVATDFFEQERTSSLLQRFATLDEIASTVCYLASPLSSATNGAVIKLDGGTTGGIL